MCASGSSDGRGFQNAEAAATPSTTRSKTERCANSREPATQIWPELKKMPPAAAGATSSTLTSGITITGDLPPSSRLTRLSESVALLVDDLADLGRAGERDLVDVGVLHQPVARPCARCR